jgi:hypothetical protein
MLAAAVVERMVQIREELVAQEAAATVEVIVQMEHRELIPLVEVAAPALLHLTMEVMVVPES